MSCIPLRSLTDSGSRDSVSKEPFARTVAYTYVQYICTSKTRRKLVQCEWERRINFEGGAAGIRREKKKKIVGRFGEFARLRAASPPACQIRCQTDISVLENARCEGERNDLSCFILPYLPSGRRRLYVCAMCCVLCAVSNRT
jgi:hypothetical protein